MWRLRVELAEAAELDLSAEALRFREGTDCAPVTLSVPERARPVDPAAAKCSFSRKRGQLVVEWPRAAARAAADAEPPAPPAQEAAAVQVPDAEAVWSTEEAAPAPSVSAEEWRTRGNAAVRAGGMEEAVRCYAAGLEAGGGDTAMLCSNRALCLQKLGRDEEALEDARRCVALRPDFFKGYLRGAMSLRSLGRPEEALAFLRRCPPNDEAGRLVAELRPEAEAAERARIVALGGAERAKEEGNVLFRKGLFEDALAKYGEALECCEDPEGELALALRNNRAACSHQLGDFGAVVREASFVLERQPANAKALARRMLALEPLERYQAALADARALLRQDPRHETANKTQHRLSKLVRDMERTGGA